MLEDIRISPSLLVTWLGLSVRFKQGPDQYERTNSGRYERRQAMVEDGHCRFEKSCRKMRHAPGNRAISVPFWQRVRGRDESQGAWLEVAIQDLVIGAWIMNELNQ
jgi:hypothetical protein